MTVGFAVVRERGGTPEALVIASASMRTSAAAVGHASVGTKKT
jgi:hypothetical protein